MKKSGKLQLIGKILSILSIGFVIYSVIKMGLDFSFVNNIPLFILLVIAGIGIKLLSMWLSATGWSQWLSFFSRGNCIKREARRVYLRANIGKYIPGNVMHYVQRNLFATGLGISQLQLAISTILESASLVSVALLTAMLFAWDNLKMMISKRFENGLPIAVIVAVICFAAAVLVFLFLFRKKIRAALTGYSFKEFIKTLLKVMLLQLTSLLLLAMVMVMLVWYVQRSLNLEMIGLTISTYVVAWVLGYIIPGASGGIGIREATLLLLLGPIMGDSLTLSLAMIHRLITIIGDFLGYLIVMIQIRKSEGENQHA